MDPDQESKYRALLQEATAQTRKRTTAVRFRQATSRSTETRLNASATVDYGEWAIQDSHLSPSRYQEPRSDTTSCPQSGAPGGGTRRQVVTEAVSTEDELKRIGEAWPKLPQNIRHAMLALVEPFSEREREGKK